MARGLVRGARGTGVAGLCRPLQRTHRREALEPVDRGVDLGAALAECPAHQMAHGLVVGVEGGAGNGDNEAGARGDSNTDGYETGT